MFLDANIFQPLISVFQSVVYFFHHSVGLGWGWSIILLTICVRMIMIPLTIKQFHSMRRLQMHQPEMKGIQQKYKEDKQRQQQEMMKFYKENNVNPLASCLPMLLQLPVFISLFYMLRKNLRSDICQPIQTRFQQHYATTYMAAHHVTEKVAHAVSLGQTVACGPVKGAGFLFIDDITNNAHGLTLIVLLVLYVGTQAVSTMIMSAPTMDKTQRQLMMAMPLLFVLFVIRFPAGLLVYWITTNAWTMVQQFALKRIIGPPPVANPVMVVEEVREAEQGLLSKARALIGGAGSATAANGSSKVNGSAKGNGAPRRPNAAPPPSPRKKKKRSGRRR
jgi:YidC/Oxa1 family membrane protein insertase